MASILKVDTITGVSTAGSIAVTGEGNSTTTNLQQGLAKAWGNISGSGTATLDNSLNVSSLTDHGTADYSINFSTSFANNEICTTALAINMGSGDRLYPSLNAYGTSSAARVATFDEDGNTVDSGEVNIVVHGDI
jgi:hypothetical protein